LNNSADVIVVGLGAMGSAAAAFLAGNGHRVSAFDRFSPPHARGSSHGRSRIFRQAYWEDSRYVHLLLRAHELWRKMERDCGRELLHITGALMIAPQNAPLVARSLESARQFGLSHEVLTAADLNRCWPQFRVVPDTVALLEHNGGYLVPETCVEEQLAAATRAGAQLHYDEPVLEWGATTGGVTVRTGCGSYAAGCLVLTAGPWAPQLLEDLDLPMRVTRQAVYWFQPREHIELFRRDRLPIYLFDTGDGQPILYGFPLTGPDEEGAKVAVHGSNTFCTPETANREVDAEEEHSMRERIASALPSLTGRLVRAETCLYTMTPDENFILGPHPLHPNVILAAGFSGHGFKFAPVVGQILGELATTGKSSFDLAMFSPARFASTSTRGAS
jgi:sarcosine oxidase